MRLLKWPRRIKSSGARAGVCGGQAKPALPVRLSWSAASRWLLTVCVKWAGNIILLEPHAGVAYFTSRNTDADCCMKEKLRTTCSIYQIAAPWPHYKSLKFCKRCSGTVCVGDIYTQVDSSINVSDLCSGGPCLESQPTHIILYHDITSHEMLTTKSGGFLNTLTYFLWLLISLILLNLLNNIVFVSEFKWILFGVQRHYDWINELFTCTNWMQLYLKNYTEDGSIRAETYVGF